MADAWATCVRSARDRHEQNLELLRGEDGLVARTLREIGRGEQLLVWYEEGLARELGVPILTLSHIRGHQSYMCTGCGTAFTHPNILKAHIFLQCSQAATAPTSTTESLVPFHQLLQTISKRPESTAWPGGERRHVKRVKHSAMDDFQDCGSLPASNPHSSRMSPSVRHLRHGNPYSFSLPSDKEPLDMLPQAYFANKSKKGHLCLCCGKLYSRKYGLKIHMRTHNGYKPLKCKICSRPFGDPSNLNKHVRLHAQGETPYRCEYCGKVLVRRRDLERHVRSRHPMGCLGTDEGLPLCESS
ncbi:unnamed protein product, partial [Lymnaea stagnalis]